MFKKGLLRKTSFVLVIIIISFLSILEIEKNIDEKANKILEKNNEFRRISENNLKQSFVNVNEINSEFKSNNNPITYISDGVESKIESNFSNCLDLINNKINSFGVSPKGDLILENYFNYNSINNQTVLLESIFQGNGRDSELIKIFENSALFKKCLSNMSKSKILDKLNLNFNKNMVWVKYSFKRYNNVKLGPNTKGFMLEGRVQDKENFSMNIRAYLISIIYDDMEGNINIVSSNRGITDIDEKYFNDSIPKITNLLEINLKKNQMLP